MKRSYGTSLAAVLALALVACTTPTGPATKSSAAAMSAFAFSAVANSLQLSADVVSAKSAFDNTWTTPPLPAGTDTSILVPTFTLSPKAKAYVNDVQIVSGVSVVDFSLGNVEVTVVAEDGTTETVHTVNVSAPELGFSSFRIDVVGFPGGTMPLTVDNTAHTITGEIPYSYRDAINESGEASVVTFTANAGATVWEGATELSSTVSTLDFSPSGMSSHTITLDNGDLLSVDYTITVTAAATASADADITSFSVVSGGQTYTGSIVGDEITVPKLPPYANIAALTASFSMDHVSATLADGATVLVSGTTAIDLRADRPLTATAEDGTIRTYTVKAADNKPAAAIVAMDVDSYTDGMKYIDVKIYDKAAAGALSMGYLTAGYDNTYFSSLSALPFWASVSDGDLIRVWDAFGTVRAGASSVNIQNDTVMADNTADRWDVRNGELTGPGYFMAGYMVVVLRDAGGAIVNLAPLSTSATWFSTSPVAFETAVTAGYWNASTQAASITHGGTATAKYVRLLAGKTHGTSAADWEIRTDGPYFSFTLASATPSVNYGVGGTVTLSITPTMFNGAVASSVFADLSAIGGAANTAFSEAAGVWSTTFEIAPTLAAATYSVPVDARGSASGAASKTYSGNEIKVTVLPPKDISIASFTASPTIAPVNPASTVTLTVDVAGLNGDSVSTVTVDTAAINATGPASLVNSSGSLWTATVAVDAGLAVGAKTLTATATSASGVVKTSDATVTVSADPIMTISSFTADKYLVANATADTVVLTADIIGLNGASPDTVIADLSAFGGSATAAFTNSSGNLWTCDISVPNTQAPGAYTVIVTANNVANSLTETESLVIRVRYPLAFTNSDFEGAITTTTFAAACTYESGVIGWDGSSTTVLHVNGTVANSTVFLTTNPGTAKGAYTKVTFRLRTITAAAKGLLFEFGNATSSVPIGALFTVTTVGATDPGAYSPNLAVASMAYPATTIDTTGAWVKVTLNIATTDTAKQFMIRLGSGTYNFMIDDIVFE